MKRINIAKFQGVYYRESDQRRHNGKPDRCFDIAYKDSQGRLIWEKVGWLRRATPLPLRHNSGRRGSA